MTRNKRTLLDQVNDRMRDMRAWGESRHDAKVDGTARSKIFSYDTYTAYWKVNKAFVKWCREEYRLKKLEDCQQYVDTYLKKLQEEGKSGWTLGQARASLRKLFQDETLGSDIDIRQKRSEAHRSRTPVEYDKHFSESKNAELVAFCRATGLRRHELAALKRDCPTRIDPITGDLYLLRIKGKGGKVRDVLVLDKEPVLKMLDGSEGKVFEHVHSAADIHSYRADYAAALYDRVARPAEELARKDRYCCRGDKAGTWYDRAALRVVSENLGHNRVSVVADSYLWKVG